MEGSGETFEGKEDGGEDVSEGCVPGVPALPNEISFSVWKLARRQRRKITRRMRESLDIVEVG